LNKKKSVFISYSWNNKSSVNKLYNVLSEKGFNYWIDERSMQAGAQLFGEIESGISDCEVFIACCSNNYSSSLNCQRELLLASDRKKAYYSDISWTYRSMASKRTDGSIISRKDLY